MTEDRLPHRLTVVWFTDLVGYSTLAAQDEDRAIALVRRFQAAVRASIPSDSGRIVKFIGDAALVESPSAESALVAAATLRESLGDGEAVRTGIHLGDVAVAPDGDLRGQLPLRPRADRGRRRPRAAELPLQLHDLPAPSFCGGPNQFIQAEAASRSVYFRR